MLKSGINNFFILIIRIYQIILSPHMGGACRFQPTCSHYGIEVLKKNTPGVALLLIFRRIWKCRPGSSFGYDPAPEGNLNERT